MILARLPARTMEPGAPEDLIARLRFCRDEAAPFAEESDPLVVIRRTGDASVSMRRPTRAAVYFDGKLSAYDEAIEMISSPGALLPWEQAMRRQKADLRRLLLQLLEARLLDFSERRTGA